LEAAFPIHATVRLRRPGGDLLAYTQTDIQSLDHARHLGQYLWEVKGGKGPYAVAGMLLSYEPVQAVPPPQAPLVHRPPAPPEEPSPPPVPETTDDEEPEGAPPPYHLSPVLQKMPEPEDQAETPPQEVASAPPAPVLSRPLRLAHLTALAPRRAEKRRVPSFRPLQTVVVRVRERSEQMWRIPERALVLAGRWGGVQVRVPLPEEAAGDPDGYVTSHLDRGPLVIAGVRVPEPVDGVQGVAVHVQARGWMKDGGGEVLDVEPGDRRRVVVR
jgi:hypothetical protein